MLPLLLYGRNILRLGVPLPKNSSISYERALPPSCSPAAQIPYGMHRTAEGAGENVTFPPHPPNTARHLPLKGKALLVRPICLHNFSLHNFVYATIKRIPYPSQYAVLCYIFIHFKSLLLCQINLHNSVDIITIFSCSSAITAVMQPVRTLRSAAFQMMRRKNRMTARGRYT